jgi:hypothetical protein
MPTDYLHNHEQFPELIRIVAGQKGIDPVHGGSWLVGRNSVTYCAASAATDGLHFANQPLGCGPDELIKFLE